MPVIYRMIYESKTIIGGSCHKYNFCRDKRVFFATKDEKNMLVTTKLCLSQQKLLSRKKKILVVAPASDTKRNLFRCFCYLLHGVLIT